MASGIQAEIASAVASFRFNQGALDQLLRGRGGPVMRDLSRRAIRIEAAAKENATHRPGPMVRLGRLRGSITWRLGADFISPYADIGSAVLYAPFLEKGTSRMPAYPFLLPALSAGRIG